MTVAKVKKDESTLEIFTEKVREELSRVLKCQVKYSDLGKTLEESYEFKFVSIKMNNNASRRNKAKEDEFKNRDGNGQYLSEDW